MCGIAGWIQWDGDLSNEGPTIERMSETLRRRGPDEKGRWLSKQAAFGHRRLSVMDPANGQQPMVHTVGGRTVALVYNGELYNFIELRDDLIARGHVFRTRCDTEVVLHSYLEWGADCVARFDGIFAFGIWDEAKQELLLGRDRMGVKPLFFTQREGVVLFASEIKALLAHPLVPAEVDAEGYAELLVAAPSGAYAPTPGVTPFRGVREVRPSRTMVFRRGDVRETIYWERVSAPHTDDLETTVVRIRELLGAAVKRQLMSDVPLACLLSGGLDSSGITALARREMEGATTRLQSWVVDFEGDEKNFVAYRWLPNRDAPFAAETAAALGTDHNAVVLDGTEMLDGLLDVMRARDLPTGVQYDTSLLLLFKQLKSKATVALSGECADELFGGYWFLQADHAGFPWSRPWAAGESAEVAARFDIAAYMKRRYEESLPEIPRLAGESDAAAKWREKIYLLQTRFLSFLLARKDRMGMYVGVEGRVPFCDHHLLQYMWNVPQALQSVDGVEKSLLRRALTGLLPSGVVNRKKSVFPRTNHPLYLQGLRDRARDLLAGTSPATPLFDVANLRRLCEPADETLADDLFVLEHFIQTDVWLKEYRVRLL